MDKTICFYCEHPIDLCDCEKLAEFQEEQKRLAKRLYPVVQVKPEHEMFGGCFVTIIERKSSGRVMGYVQIPGKGQAYCFLNADDYGDTGGQAVWAVVDPEDVA